jgi:tRNA A-37 threonylcarbamoyl transferase component Bud32
MACRVRYLNSAGIHIREIRGIDGIAAAFPERWLLYASLQCTPKNTKPIEMDAMVVMDDRVMLLEIKDWTGLLEANGDRWIVNGKGRGRSPVDSVNMKARQFASFLKSSIKDWGDTYVDSRVVLTGSSTKEHLTTNEQNYVLNLDEVVSLATKEGRERLLESRPLSARKVYEFEPDFERLARNARLFRPLEQLWNGFRVVEEDFVEHPRGLWKEHRAELAKDPRTKALLRLWSFDRLPPSLNAPEHRWFLAERENRALAYLETAGSPLIPAGVLMPIHQDKDEILTQHDELRRVVAGWTTLDRYLERMGPDSSYEERTLTAATLLKSVAELHAVGIAHRDLGMRNVWIKTPTSQALTGFMACQIPGDNSMGEWLDTIRSGTGRTVNLASKELDLDAAARLTLEIVTGKQDTSDISRETPQELRAWFNSALGLGGAERFRTARHAAEAFGAALDSEGVEPADNALLDRFQTAEVPYSRWPVTENIAQNFKRHVYRSALPGADQAVIVKLWFSWTRGLSAASDVKLGRLLSGVTRIQSAGRLDLPNFVSAGISAAGAYVVYSEQRGTLWPERTASGVLPTLALCHALIRAVEALHGLGLSHGDLHPKNVVVKDNEEGVALLDLFDFSGVGDGAVRGGYCPDNADRLSPEALDRYAVARIVQDAVFGCADSETTDFLTFLKNECEKERIETLEPLLQQIKGLERAVAAAWRPNVVVAMPDAEPGPLNTFGEVQLSRAYRQMDGSIEYLVTGARQELIMMVKDGSVVCSRIGPTGFRSLGYASHFGIELDFNITVERRATNDFQDLLELLVARTPVVVSDRSGGPAVRTSAPATAPATADQELDVARYWRRLVELEDEYQPTVQITKEISRIGDVGIYAIERTGADFDFDPEDQVEVRLIGGGRVGELDLSQTDDRVLVVRHSSNRRLALGDRVILAERLARSSLDRRAKAVERVLDNEAGVRGLIGFFDPTRDISATDYGLEVSDDELAPYKLNDGQTAAFRRVARFGPVALQQGPPGTGKTHFIAAFVHWLITRQGVERILIASQSHEAVNNAIEAIVDLYKRTGGVRPSLLRIGSKGITDKIRPFHTRAQRERYQTRFAVAMKHRVAGLGGALGLKREFVQDAVDLDQSLGSAVRRLAALHLAHSREQEDYTADDRRRHDRSVAFAQFNLRAIALEHLEEEWPDADPEALLAAAFLRLASRHGVVSRADIQRLREILDLARDWNASLASVHRNFEEFLAKTRKIVAATCVGVGQTKIRIDTSEFDWVIVDEAARCTASELAVPAQVGRRILLVGDHLQLKPMFDRNVLRALKEEMPGVLDEALERSDFERAFTSTFGKKHGVTLTEQYRMAPNICSMVSELFYQPHAVRLTTSDKRRSNEAFAELDYPFDAPAVWIDTSRSPNNRESHLPWNEHSYCNAAETDAVIRVLQALSVRHALVDALAKEDEETPIGVICMYSAQKAMLDDAVAEQTWDKRFSRLVRIETVDSYQGKENTIVIVSLVRSNQQRIAGHVSSYERCNVALSRAKERLFITGSQDMWGKVASTEPMNRVLNYFRAGKPGTRIVKPGEIK